MKRSCVGTANPGGAPHGDLRPSQIRGGVGRPRCPSCAIPSARASCSRAAFRSLSRPTATARQHVRGSDDSLRPRSGQWRRSSRPSCRPNSIRPRHSRFGELAASDITGKARAVKTARRSRHADRPGAVGRGSDMSLMSSVRQAVAATRRELRGLEVLVQHHHGITRSNSGRITYAHNDSRTAFVRPVVKAFRDNKGHERVSKSRVTFFIPRADLPRPTKLVLPNDENRADPRNQRRHCCRV